MEHFEGGLLAIFQVVTSSSMYRRCHSSGAFRQGSNAAHGSAVLYLVCFFPVNATFLVKCVGILLTHERYKHRFSEGLALNKV